MKLTLPKFFMAFILLLLSNGLFAQDKERLRRSLQALNTPISDTLRIKYLDNIGWDTSYDNLAVGLKYCHEALALAESTKNESGISHACNSIATIYQDMGDVNKAISYHLRGLKIAEKNHDNVGIMIATMNISIVYMSQQNYPEVLKYLHRSMSIAEATNDSAALVGIYNNLGQAYLAFPDSVQKALDICKKVLIIAYALDDKNEIGITLGGMAKAYQANGDTLNADIVMQRSMAILDSMGNDYLLSQSLVNYAAMLSARKQYTKAEKLMLDALIIYRKIGMIEQEKELWEGLSDLYERSGQLQKSIDALKRHTKMKDSLTNENVLRHQRELETLYQSEKNENLIASLEKDATLSKTILTSLIGGCLLLILFLFVLFNRSQLRKKTNVQLEKQKAVIEEKNKDITDSINYARRIQEAILPSPGILKKHFNDAFVFYRPRDIVSGDFWWCTEKDGKFLLAAADCTGHGVPGGFMSVMSAAFLSEIINEKAVTDPAQVLTLLRQKVISSLKQAHEQNADTSEVKDGMDISLAAFSVNNSKLDLACANNPVWLVRNKEVTIFNPDKFPVGIHHNELMPFTPLQGDLKSGDMIYLFTDGYADQFGGKEGKKYKYKQFREDLIAVSHLPCDEQRKMMEQKFDEWSGSNEQVDDVLLIGIRV